MSKEKMYRVKNKVSGAITDLAEEKWNLLKSLGYEKRFEVIDVLTTESFSPDVKMIPAKTLTGSDAQKEWKKKNRK